MRDRARLEAVARLLEAPASDDARRVVEEVDTALERISRLASVLVGTPVALVSLVEEDRQVFAAQVGMDDPWQQGTPISHSFCSHVVGDDAPLVVADARQDARLRDNPAIEDLGVIAYCGVPLRSVDGRVVGSFCVIDESSHDWTDDEVRLVEDLGALAATELLRRAGAVGGAGDAASLAAEFRRSLSAVVGGFRTVAAARDLAHGDRALYVAVVERHARHLESMLDELLTSVDA